MGGFQVGFGLTDSYTALSIFRVIIGCFSGAIQSCAGQGSRDLTRISGATKFHDPLKRSNNFNRIQFISFKGNVYIQLWNLFWICSVYGNWIGHRWPKLDLGLYHYGNIWNCACTDISITRNQMFKKWTRDIKNWTKRPSWQVMYIFEGYIGNVILLTLCWWQFLGDRIPLFVYWMLVPDAYFQR